MNSTKGFNHRNNMNINRNCLSDQHLAKYLQFIPLTNQNEQSNLIFENYLNRQFVNQAESFTIYYATVFQDTLVFSFLTKYFY